MALERPGRRRGSLALPRLVTKRCRLRHLAQLDGDADADGDGDADAEADPDFDDVEDGNSYVAPGGTNQTSVRSNILFSAYFGGP